MRILIAPDKFKGVQTSSEAAQNIAAGLRALRDAQIEIVPIADGGEGTAEVICAARDGSWRECSAHDPLGRQITVRYAWLPQTATAILEMSVAAGLNQFSSARREPDRANTFGVGEMILDAARIGARDIVIGLGGSATNDGGFGMARALGYRFFAGKEELGGTITSLTNLTRIERPENLTLPPILAAVDVRSPLLGPNGATRLFGPQKGVRQEQLEIFEKALTRLADVAACDLGVDHRAEPGAGAAGGLGFGLLTFCNAAIRSGFEVVAEAIGLESRIESCDVVITGEGSLDRQTLDGKAPAEVARLARKHGKRIFAVVGLADENKALHELFDGVFAVARPDLSEEENIRRAPELLREGARRLAELLAAQA